MTNTGPGALGAHALELDGATIGIVLPEGSRRVRFYTADETFRRLDGQLFRNAREVIAAAREAFRGRPARRTARTPPTSPPPDAGGAPGVDAEAELFAELVLAAPGPFLLPL